MAHGPELEEPKTPMWLPALGGALFLALAVWWIAAPAAPPPAPEPEPASAASASSDGGQAAPSPH
jgi:hypothetical protein